MRADRRWLVLYDGDCGLCKWLLAGLLSWDRGARLRPVALQSPEAEQLLQDLAPAERMASWHLVSPDGARRSGGSAVPELLRVLPGGRLPAAASARYPRITERAYRWVAEHRTALSRWVPASLKRRAGERVRRRQQGIEGDDG
jgi:predicted DCC family thiol-disulfide oxidoreductase YuxK